MPLRPVRPATDVRRVGFSKNDVRLACTGCESFDFRDCVWNSVQVRGWVGIGAIIEVVASAAFTAARAGAKQGKQDTHTGQPEQAAERRGH